jgi:iron(III) transport system ATP-binding protein
MMPDHRLTLNDLSKVFDTDKGQVLAVDAVSFEISSNEFFTMLGPSGCGKTTTLRLIAGLETMTGGQILFDGQNFGQVSHLERNIGMVFQSYALFPHMTVFENTAYGLRVRSVGKAEVTGKVGKALELLGLQALAERYPADLSGGQQQRVAIARALVYDPIMLLLDEPLANLDAKLRVEMREEIRRVQKELGIMAIYVTHDQEEAMAISDRIAVFNLGRLIQVGPPTEVYADPNSLFVADFIGKANFFPVDHVDQVGTRARVVLTSGVELPIGRIRSGTTDHFGLPGHDGGALVMARTEHVTLTAANGTKGEEGVILGRVKRIQFLGNLFTYLVAADHVLGDVIVDSPRAVQGISEGDAVHLTLAPDDATLFLGNEST